MGILKDAPHLINVHVDFRKSNDAGLNVFVSCIVGEDKLKVAFFYVDISVRRFHMNFLLNGASSPLTSWTYADEIPASLETKRKIKTTRMIKDKSDEKISFDLKPSSASGLGASIGAANETEVGLEAEVEFNFTEQRIFCRGNLNGPSWTISKLSHEEALKGFVIKNARLFKTYKKNESATLGVEIEFPRDGLIINSSRTNTGRQSSNTNIAALYARWAIRNQAHEVLSIPIVEE